jgi:hypothetical protein
MLLNGAAPIEETAVPFPCAAPFSNMCSTQADNSFRKLRLRCGCQFPWCAIGLIENFLGKRKLEVNATFLSRSVSQL